MNWSPVMVRPYLPIVLSVADDLRINLSFSPTCRSEILFSSGVAFCVRSEGEDGPIRVTSNPISEYGVLELSLEADCGLIFIHQSKGRLEGAFLTLLVPSRPISSLDVAYLAVVAIRFMTMQVVSLSELLHLVFLYSPQVKK